MKNFFNKVAAGFSLRVVKGVNFISPLPLVVSLSNHYGEGQGEEKLNPAPNLS